MHWNRLQIQIATQSAAEFQKLEQQAELLVKIRPFDSLSHHCLALMRDTLDKKDLAMRSEVVALQFVQEASCCPCSIPDAALTHAMKMVPCNGRP